MVHTYVKQEQIFSIVYSHSFRNCILRAEFLRDRTEEEWMVEMLRTYDFKRKQPVFEIDKIRFRNNAIYS